MQNLFKGAAIAALATVAMAGTANAAHFIGNYTVSVNTGTGLQINTQDYPGGIDFNLNSIGSWATEDLFKIYTNEGDVDPDDLVAKPITVNFTFTSPDAFGGSVGGSTVGQISGHYELGHVTWNDPVFLNFNGGQLKVTLNDADFNKGYYGLDSGSYDGAKITAKFELLGAAVPEPATWAMMIAGFGMAGVMVRRRRTVAAAA